MVTVNGSVTARDRLVALLDGVGGRGAFSVRATMRPDDLHVEVRDVGLVRFPVPVQQAKRLVSVARPARYGLGERTLLDPRVRDTWEVPKSRVKIDNRRWNPAIRPVLDRLRGELGLPEGCRLKAELHSMLVYGPGQHFAPHQDSEKVDGMVASLVVTLPSSSTGGTLVVEHGTERATYRGSRDRLSLVAFYADCRHEIRPVRTGYRVVLTYNLILVGDTAGPVPVLSDGATEALVRCLGEHFTTPVSAPAWRRDPAPLDPPDRLVYLLDHEYTTRALDWTRLKGPDAVHAAAIRDAAERADCEVVLALTDIHETWSAFESSGDDWWNGPSRGSWRPDDEEYDDESSLEDEDFELDELIESEINLVHWVDASGASAEAISTTVDIDEVCATTPSEQLRPYESNYEPYMGNYGNTMDRWYRRGAVVMWPRDRAFSVRAEASPSWALDQIAEHLDAGDLATARELVAGLTPFWTTVAGNARDVMSRASSVAFGIDDADRATMLLAPLAVEMLAVADAAGLAALCDRYGRSWMRDLLAEWSRRRRRWADTDWSGWISGLPSLVGRLLAEQPAGGVAARLLTEDAWSRLDDTLTRRSATAMASHRASALDELTAPVLAVLQSVAVSGADDLRDQALERLSPDGDDGDDATFDRFVVDVLRDGAHLDHSTRAAAGLDLVAERCAVHIERRLARPIRSADDWSLTLPGGCDCALCDTLAAFLADPSARTHEWPIAKPKRQHVHSRIDTAELPVTHRTRREGSPHKLVLTKTNDLFEREVAARRRDEADLRWLRAAW